MVKRSSATADLGHLLDALTSRTHPNPAGPMIAPATM